MNEIKFDIEPPKPFVFPDDLDDYKAPDEIPKQQILSVLERKIRAQELQELENETGISFELPKHELPASNTQLTLF
jgi:hypothetical protein